MRTLINEPHTIFPTVATAEKVAEANNGNDWTYRVVADPSGSGRAIIEIYDEEGEKIGLL